MNCQFTVLQFKVLNSGSSS